MQSTQKNEFVVRLQKADSTLRQSVLKISMKEGLPPGDYTFMTNDDFFNEFEKTVNTVKVCKGSERGCFSTSSKQMNGIYWSGFDRINSLVTADGIAYNWDQRYCDGKGLTSEDLQNCIGRFLIDLNGVSGPNRFGYDIFFFAVVNGKGVVAAGSGNDSADCKRGRNGITCAAKVLKEKKISYL